MVCNTQTLNAPGTGRAQLSPWPPFCAFWPDCNHTRTLVPALQASARDVAVSEVEIEQLKMQREELQQQAKALKQQASHAGDALCKVRAVAEPRGTVAGRAARRLGKDDI